MICFHGNSPCTVMLRHIDSWRVHGTNTSPSGASGVRPPFPSHCHSNSTDIWSVHTCSFFCCPNRDCPFSVWGPITGTLSRPLNVLRWCLIRHVEVGESFEAPFRLLQALFSSYLYVCSPEQSTRVCLMIVLCHKWTTLPLCPHHTQSWVSHLYCPPLIGPFVCPKGH